MEAGEEHTGQGGVVSSNSLHEDNDKFIFVQMAMKPDHRVTNLRNRYAIRSHAQKVTRRRRKAANEPSRYVPRAAYLLQRT